jgi:hypothetical protein
VLLHFLRSHVRRPGAEKGAHLQLGQGSRGDLTVEAVHGMNCYTSLAIVRMRERERERENEREYINYYSRCGCMVAKRKTTRKTANAQDTEFITKVTQISLCHTFSRAEYP